MSTTKRPKTTKKKEGAASRASAPALAKPKRKPATKAPTHPEPAPAAAKKVRARRSSKQPPPAPPKPIYTLDGPIPPEAAGLPKKVGALLGIGQKTLGITSFRPGQAEAFEHLLKGEDLLAVMPTGSGKSLL